MSTPDPEVDFKGFVEAMAGDAIKELAEHPMDKEPEYWVAKSAARLVKLKAMNAPSFVVEMAKRTLQRRAAALPVYCPEYDELNATSGTDGD